ncbi:hypothetical protein SARC_14840, partial [Sphaeroforma arctica JP610]
RAYVYYCTNIYCRRASYCYTSIRGRTTRARLILYQSTRSLIWRYLRLTHHLSKKTNIYTQLVTLKCSRCRASLGHTLSNNQLDTPSAAEEGIATDTNLVSSELEPPTVKNNQSNATTTEGIDISLDTDVCSEKSPTTQHVESTDSKSTPTDPLTTRAHEVTHRRICKCSHTPTHTHSPTRANPGSPSRTSMYTHTHTGTQGESHTCKSTNTPTNTDSSSDQSVCVQRSERLQSAKDSSRVPPQLQSEATFYRDMVTTSNATRTERQAEKVFTLTHKLLETAEREVTYRLSIQMEDAPTEEPILL